MSDITKATLFMLLSTFSLSISGLVAKFLTDSMPATLLSLVRFIVPSLLLFLVLLFHRINKIPKGLRKPLWIRAACMVACQLCFLSSLQSLSLVESIVLFSTGPVFIPVLEKLIFNTEVKASTFIFLLVTFFGVVLMAGELSQFEIRMELLIGLLAGLFNSGSQVSLYRASKGSLTPAEMNAWTFFIAGMIVLPITILDLTYFDHYEALIMNDEWSLDSVSGIGFSVLFLALATINTQIFRSKAYQLASSGTQLAPLIFTNLLFSAIWQFSLFDDRFSPQQLLGISLIVLASLGNTLLNKKSSSSKTRKVQGPLSIKAGQSHQVNSL